MKKLIIAILFFGNLTYSQELYKLEYLFIDKNKDTLNSSLFTNNKETVYKIYDNRETGTTELGEGKMKTIINDELSTFFYSTSEITYTRTALYLNKVNREVIYKDDINGKINWVISSTETKKIGKYTCNKATLNINGRTFFVWFTYELPINYGPLKLHHLPGAVIEVEESKGFLKIVLKKIQSTKENNEFEKYKNYFLNQKNIQNYQQFENYIVDYKTALYRKTFSDLKIENIKNNTDYKLTINWLMEVEEFLEIPKNLLSELKKIK